MSRKNRQSSGELRSKSVYDFDDADDEPEAEEYRQRWQHESGQTLSNTEASVDPSAALSDKCESTGSLSLSGVRRRMSIQALRRRSHEQRGKTSEAEATVSPPSTSIETKSDVNQSSRTPTSRVRSITPKSLSQSFDFASFLRPSKTNDASYVPLPPLVYRSENKPVDVDPLAQQSHSTSTKSSSTSTANVKRHTSLPAKETLDTDIHNTIQLNQMQLEKQRQMQLELEEQQKRLQFALEQHQLMNDAQRQHQLQQQVLQVLQAQPQKSDEIEMFVCCYCYFENFKF